MSAFILQKLCRSCKRCIFACPKDAIRMISNQVTVNPDKCEECEECIEVCMHGAITFQTNMLTNV